MIIFMLIVATFLWLSGYFMTARIMSNTGVLSDELEKIVAPPQWLYYLCGAPHPVEYPRGTMRVAAFRSQILGTILIFCVISSKIWRMSDMETLVSIAVGVVIAFMVTAYISKNYQAKNRVINRKKKKAT